MLTPAGTPSSPSKVAQRGLAARRRRSRFRDRRSRPGAAGGVLLAPPLYSDENGRDWWQRYQPKDYRVIRSHLGRKADVKRAIDALDAETVRAYADVVFNHMANEKNRDDPYNFPGSEELARYRDERTSFAADRLYGDLDVDLFSGWDFNPKGDIHNWNNAWESQERWLSGLPDLDLNDWVVKQQQVCLRALNDLGFDGYRIDAIKHLPNEHIARVFQTRDMEGRFFFGEALTANDNEERIFLWPLLRSTPISFYDFPLRETLRRVFPLPEACASWSIRRRTVRLWRGIGASLSASPTTSPTTTDSGGSCSTLRTSSWPMPRSWAATADCRWCFPITTRAPRCMGRTGTGGPKPGAAPTSPEC